MSPSQWDGEAGASQDYETMYTFQLPSPVLTDKIKLLRGFMGDCGAIGLSEFQVIAADARSVLNGNSGTLNLSGNLDSRNLTFNSGTSNFNLTGTSQNLLIDNISFYNLTKTVSSSSTLTFTNSATTTVTHALVLQGAVGNLLSLRSDNLSLPFYLYSAPTNTTSYLNVKGSVNTNATIIACSLGGRDDVRTLQSENERLVEEIYYFCKNFKGLPSEIFPRFNAITKLN